MICTFCVLWLGACKLAEQHCQDQSVPEDLLEVSSQHALDLMQVADVGLAKFMTNEHFTQVSTIGTLAWAAPELLK